MPDLARAAPQDYAVGNDREHFTLSGTFDPGHGWQREQAGVKAARLLNFSIPLFKLAGIRIRLHWSFLPIVVLFSAWTATGSTTLLGQLGWGFVHAVILYGFVLMHELSHAGAAALKGCSTDHILLTPLGGAAVIDGAMVGPGAEAEVALAGPSSNLLVLGLAMAAVSLLGMPHTGSVPLDVTLHFAFWANLIQALFNLIPAYPLDGGRVLRALLSWRRGEKVGTKLAARVGEVLSVGLIIVGIWMRGPAGWILAFIGLSNIFQCESAIRQIELGYGVYERPAWGVSIDVPDRRAEKRQRAEREQVDLDRAVDSLLDKVSREGIGSLTRKEKAVLKKASRKYRNTNH